MARTPVHGVPTYHAAIESLREDLRNHAATDERELATIRDDIKGLLVETSAQTPLLEQIKTSISYRASTDNELVRYNRKKRLQLWGAILAMTSALVGALLHHFL